MIFKTNILKAISLLVVLFFAAQPISASGYNDSQRSRIAWDKSTLVEIFDGGNYGRMIELSDGSLFAVAGGREGVVTSRSFDNGASWEKPQVAVKHLKQSGKTASRASVPEIMELSNGNLLLTYNPRPNETLKSGRRYGIRALLSSDKGKSWSDEIFVYDAHEVFANGCWEPQTIELPSGEIQLYFANEKPYTKSGEQNISMCSSTDGGKSWSKAKMVSFRAKHRDGMPVAAYLEHSGDIVIAIEDNGVKGAPRRMRPAIVRSKELWADGAVLSGEGEPRRESALVEPLQSMDNAAAPYIRQAATGEVILSYQGSENRDVPIKNGVKTNDNSQEMFVAVGNRDARNFTNKSTPFDLPLGPNGVFPDNGKGYQGLWNSVSATKNGAVWAITSTNAYKYPNGGVYGIRGYLLGEIIPSEIGSKQKENDPDIVIAHKLESQLLGYLSADATTLQIDLIVKNITRKDLPNAEVSIVLASKDGSEQIEFKAPCKRTPISKAKYSRRSKECKIELTIPKTKIEKMISEGWIYLNATLKLGSKSESIDLTTNAPSTWLRVVLNN